MNTRAQGQGQGGKATTSGQDVLQPKPKDRRKRSLLLEINSRNRILKSFPSSMQFRWRLPTPLRDVSSVQLVGGTVPARIFNIYEPMNGFTFLENSVRWPVRLQAGRYTPMLLAAEIATKINALGLSNTYTVAISATTEQLVITRATGLASFAILFGTGDFVDVYDAGVLMQPRSVARVLGFLPEDISDTAGIITSPFAVNLSGATNRLYLYLNADNTQNMGCVARPRQQEPFTIIYLDSTAAAESADAPTYKTFTQDVFQPTFWSVPAPIGRLSVLDISVRDEFGNLVDAAGRDMTLLLEITYVE